MRNEEWPGLKRGGISGEALCLVFVKFTWWLVTELTVVHGLFTEITLELCLWQRQSCLGCRKGLP